MVDENNNIGQLDKSKAYASLLLKLKKIPVARQFDNFQLYSA